MKISRFLATLPLLHRPTESWDGRQSESTSGSQASLVSVQDQAIVVNGRHFAARMPSPQKADACGNTCEASSPSSRLDAIRSSYRDQLRYEINSIAGRIASGFQSPDGVIGRDILRQADAAGSVARSDGIEIVVPRTARAKTRAGHTSTWRGSSRVSRSSSV